MSCIRAIFEDLFIGYMYVASLNFVQKRSEIGSSPVTLAGGESFVKHWEVGQSIHYINSFLLFRDVSTSSQPRMLCL